jgi:hypothetical protein
MTNLSFIEVIWTISETDGARPFWNIVLCVCMECGQEKPRDESTTSHATVTESFEIGMTPGE